MKKFTVLLIVCGFMLINLGNAQDVQFGVKGSFLTSTLNSQGNGWGKMTPGYDAGIFAQYNISDKFGVSLEPTFAQKGINDFDPYLIYYKGFPLLTDINNEPINYKSHSLVLSVISLPILAQLSMDMGGMKMRLFAGPSFDFISKATHLMEHKLSETDEGSNSEAVATERFKYTDYTAVVGIGFDIEMKPIDLRFDLKYQHGFTDINNVDGKPTLYTRTFGVSLGIGLEKLFF